MKALIPAAGLGTRWYPWSKIVPKELLPLGSYSAIHYVLEEAVSAEINEIGIIISEAKALIKTYVEEIWKPKHPETPVSWFYQAMPTGVADALLCAKEWLQRTPTAVLYPDEIHPLEGGIIQLRYAYERSLHCCIGLTTTKQRRRQSVLEVERITENIFRVYGSHGKNTQQVRYGTGRYILGSGLEYLDDYLSDLAIDKSEELDDNMIFKPLWKQFVQGIVLREPIYDIGSPPNWISTIKSGFDFRLGD